MKFISAAGVEERRGLIPPSVLKGRVPKGGGAGSLHGKRRMDFLLVRRGGVNSAVRSGRRKTKGRWLTGVEDGVPERPSTR